MEIDIRNFQGNIRNLLRKAGYHPDREQREGSLSFSRPLRGTRYPRFHIYYKKERERLSLHLDQKPSKYKHAPDHGAEYQGPQIEEEVKRIRDLIQWNS